MKKKITAILLAGAMCASLMSGCGGMNKNAVAAVMNGAEVSLGLANFYCRYQQASVEDIYKMYFGDDVWTQDLYGSGTSFQDTMKDSVMDTLHDLYTLKLHMSDYNVELTADEKKAIKDAAEKFMSDNSKAAIKEMGATQSIVEEFLTLCTIQNKMTDAIKAAADTNVSDEEANMRAYTMVKVATDTYTGEDGNTVEYTEDEVSVLKLVAEEMVTALAEEEGATLESVAQEKGYETSKSTYATYETADDDAEDDPVIAALKGLKEGEHSGLIETDDAFYIVRVDADTDEEATGKNRESIIDQRKSDYYTEILDGWQEEDDWYVDEEELAKIQFENGLTINASES